MLSMELLLMKTIGIRRLILQNLNLSDEFIRKLSFILANKEKYLPDLEYLDLSYNKRITSFGLKYLFANIIKRIDSHFKIKINDYKDGVDNNT